MEWSRQEMVGADLGDSRYQTNSEEILYNLGEKAGLSFSAALGSRLRKCSVRLFKQTDIDLQKGHRDQSVNRSLGQGRILALQDSTDVNYHSHKSKAGMGDIGGRCKVAGIKLHNTLAVSTLGEPLGVIDQYIFAPEVGVRDKHKYKYALEEKDSYKWISGLRAVDTAYGGKDTEVLVVGDRESDFYEYLSYPRSSNIELLVRGSQLKRNILVDGQKSKVRELPNLFAVKGYTQVQVSQQKNRPARTANLEVRYGKFTYPPARHKKGDNLELNFVHVREMEQDKDPIEWYLFTTLKIDALEQALELVDYYTKRWIIERFHYTLKTGLKIEKLQHDTFNRLANALRMYAIVAWRILHLTYVGKARPEHLAEEVFEADKIEILTVFTKKQIKTVRDFILALGSLVGFTPSKKQPLPGEKLLWQALGQLNFIQIGWKMAKNNSS